MGNQQVSTLEKQAIRTLAINAKFGDGYFWKHPKCVNYKVIYTSTDISILEAKMEILPEIFPSGISLFRKAGYVQGVTDNAKALYKLTSLVNPLFTKYAKMNKEKIIRQLTLTDLGLWYLDDGCCIRRGENSFRFILCIGNTCDTNIKMKIFKRKINQLFSLYKRVGTIKKNNSKATVHNKNWMIPVPIAKVIMNESIKFCNIQRKLPYGETSETIPEGSRELGL